MRCDHRVAGWRPVVAIGAAGFMAGMMLAGGTSEVFASTPLAPVRGRRCRVLVLQ
jgi:hypothetical protein